MTIKELNAEAIFFNPPSKKKKQLNDGVESKKRFFYVLSLELEITFRKKESVWSRVFFSCSFFSFFFGTRIMKIERKKSIARIKVGMQTEGKDT